MKPHKHAELIKAWADGYTIQMKSKIDGRWWDQDDPDWAEEYEYRIKPDVKQPVVRWQWAYKQRHGEWISLKFFLTEQEAVEAIKEIGIDEYIKLEYTRTEFPE